MPPRIIFEPPENWRKISEGNASVSGDTVFHLRNVLRLRDSISLLVSNGTDRFFRASLTIENKIVEIHPSEKIPSPAQRVHVCIPYIRKKRLKWAAEKLTELGAHSILLTRPENTAQPQYNLRFLEETIRSAAEQCRRLDLPKVVPVADYPVPETGIGFVGVQATHRSILSYQEEIQAADEVVCVIGPEGGFTSDEEVGLKKDFRPIRLSKNVLRSETAAVTMMAQLLLVTKE